jgi:flagellar hook-length control protein FliK
MELTLALDAGPTPASVAAADAKAPGTDPNDATAVAFASLLASLVAGAAPTPDPTVPAVPEAAVAEAAPIAAEVVPPVVTLPLDVPIALPAAPPAPPVPTPAPEAEAAPGTDGSPAPAELAPTLFALPEAASGRPVEVATGDADADAELDLGVDAPDAPDVPAAKHRPAEAVRPAPVPLPEAAAAVAGPLARPTEAATEGEGRTAPDPVATVTHPSTHAPAAPAREVLKPEIVSGPGAARPATPVEQVVKAVAPLRRLADGTHNVVLELHPAELGAVRVELSLDRGIVHLGLRADVEGTGHLLRAALPELRSQLDAAGLTSGRVSVDAGQAGPRGDGQPSWRADPDRGRRRPLVDDAELVEELVPSAYSTSDYGQLDVRL